MDTANKKPIEEPRYFLYDENNQQLNESAIVESQLEDAKQQLEEAGKHVAKTNQLLNG